MNARRERKERNLTWRIQEDSNCWTLLDTFGELPGVHFMHTIFRFEAQEVSNPTLQKVHDSKLKWRRYSRWKPIKPSWRPISQAVKWQEEGYKISLWLPNGDLQLAKFHSHLACLRNSPECFEIFAIDTFRFFSSDIWCLNPHFLLVIHQS